MRAHLLWHEMLMARFTTRATSTIPFQVPSHYQVQVAHTDRRSLLHVDFNLPFELVLLPLPPCIKGLQNLTTTVAFKRGGQTLFYGTQVRHTLRAS